MFRIVNQASLASLAVATLLAFAVACGGGDGGSAPPPPPAPPPFQPQSIAVTLGESGGTVTLMTTQAGGHTLNGQAFSSGGTVTGEGDREYVLTLTNGTWSAAYQVPEFTVTLGSSGQTVTVTQAEDRTYMVGETALDGDTWTAENGNMYRLIERSGMLEAEFVVPEPESIALGQSGETIEVQRLESGQYTFQGQLFISGQVLALADGRQFRFTLTIGGMWMAEFIPPPPITVALGTTSMTVMLTRLETGGYALGGEPVESGQVRRVSGIQYRFTQSARGDWSADFVSETIRIPLGTQGTSIQVTSLESGEFNYAGAIVSSGQTVTVNGNQYRMTYGNGRWVGEFVPEPVTVSVGSSDITITLLRLEDGRYEHNGQIVETGQEIEVGDSTYQLTFANGMWTASTVAGPVIVVRAGSRGDFITLIRRPDGDYEDENGRRVGDGSIVRSENGVRYVLSLANNEWSSRIYFPSTGGTGTGGTGTGGTGGTGTGGTGGTPVVAEDLRDAIRSSLLTRITGASAPGLLAEDEADAENVSYSQYEGNGAVQSETFVAAARRVLQDIVDDVRPLVEGSEAEQDVARLLLNNRWAAARTALGTIFDVNDASEPAGEVLLPDLNSNVERIDQEDRLDDLEDLLEALSSESNFEGEFGSSGEFRAYSALENIAGDIYNASNGATALGATDNTRFGVVVDPPSGSTTAESVAEAASVAYAVRAFAYSPLEEASESSLPVRGTARYTGRTFAADTSGKVFDGSIEVLISFGVEEISAMITNLESAADNDPWRFDGRDVEKIELSIDASDTSIGNSGFTSTATAEVTLDGTRFTETPPSTFSGKFVGDSGEELFGLWSITGTGGITGAYGAEYRSTQRVALPDSDSNGETVGHALTGDGVTLSESAGTLTVSGVTDFEAGDNEFNLRDLYRSATRSARADIGDPAVRHTLTVRSRHTRYTRFGAWARTSADDLTFAGGWYGYGSLPATTTAPSRVEAEYNGRTVAVVDATGTLYEGEYTLAVDWDGTGRIESSITNLRAASGGSRLEFNNSDVSVIAFEDTAALAFDTPTRALVEYTNGTDEVLSGTTHAGQFLGQPTGADGPFAVVGSWAVTHGGTTIEGVFGADLDPTP